MTRSPARKDVTRLAIGYLDEANDWRNCLNEGRNIAADLHSRSLEGIATYGTPLQTYNGRDALIDAYEELLDAFLYIVQATEESEAIDRFVVDEVLSALDSVAAEISNREQSKGFLANRKPQPEPIIDNRFQIESFDNDYYWQIAKEE